MPKILPWQNKSSENKHILQTTPKFHTHTYLGFTTYLLHTSKTNDLRSTLQLHSKGILQNLLYFDKKKTPYSFLFFFSSSNKKLHGIYFYYLKYSKFWNISFGFNLERKLFISWRCVQIGNNSFYNIEILCRL